MTDSPPKPLVSTEWLADHLGDDDVRVFDCTVHLRPDPTRTYRIESGRDGYEEAHVPGAAFLDLPGELSDPSSPLAFTMPSAHALADALGSGGLGDDHTAVLYASSSVMWATRVWWMLRSCGYERAFVLDGGFAKWQAEGRPSKGGIETHAPATFTATLDAARWADRDEVLGAIGSASVCTLNALPSTVHTGEGGASYGRPGHIAGSVNVPFPSLLRDDGTYRPLDEIREAFSAVPALGAERVICYCGGGISATMDAMALHLLGHADVAVYDGSMSEWCADPDLPMATGD